MGVRELSRYAHPGTTGILPGQSFSFDASTGANRLLVVGVVIKNGASQTVTGITYGGAALTFLGAAQTGAGSASSWRAEVWYRLAPATGTNTVAVTLSAAATHCVLARSFIDVHQTTPFGTFVTGSASTASVSVTPTVAATDYVMDVLAQDFSSAEVSASGPGQQAVLHTQAGSGPGGSQLTNGASSLQAGSEPTGAAMSWSGDADYRALIAVPIKPTGSGPVDVLVTQETVETLFQPSTQRARVSQLVTEALTQPANTQRARLSQLVVEALYASDLPPAPTGSDVQRWDGSAWQTAAVKRWDGAAWVTATVKRWNGSAWV